MDGGSRRSERENEPTDEGRIGPYAALLAAALRDPQVAHELALAYCELEAPLRSRLVQATVSDAEAEGLSPGLVLVHLLAVEQDLALAREIAQAVERSGRPRADAEVRLRGNEHRGTALLVQANGFTNCRALALSWTEDGISDARFETAEALDGIVERMGERFADLPVVPLPSAVDVLSRAVWRHLRSGRPMPSGLEHFVGLFSIGAPR